MLTAGFLAVVPGRRTWFTRFGSATMYVYLLHGFATLFLSYQGWYYRATGAEVVLVTAGCVVLARRPVQRRRTRGCSGGRSSHAWTGSSSRVRPVPGGPRGPQRALWKITPST